MSPVYNAGGGAGTPGASAYAVAVASGFVGNEAAWLTSLVGADGEPGAAGADSTVPGPQGDPGTTDYNALQNVPATFTPAAHAHAASEITGTAVVTNDARLSDARTPTAHDQAISTVTGLQTALDAKEAANANIQTHVGSAHAPSGAQVNADITKAEIEAKLTGQLSSHSHAGGGGFTFPVGSIYENASDSTNPATLFGYGTWELLGSGRVLVGIDAGDTAFDVAGETGGAKTHTLLEAEIPAHSHGLTRFPTTTGGSSGFTADTSMSGTPAAVTQVTAATGGGGAHNNLQPYIVVYRWVRTA